MSKGNCFQHRIEFGEEKGDAVVLIFHLHAFDGEADNIYRRERNISPADRSFRAKTILEDARAAAHRRHFVEVAFRVVGAPRLVLVEGRVEIQEVGEKAAGRNLARQLVEVVVAVGRQIADAAFLFPYLDGEDGGFAIAHAPVRRFQQLADDATPLGGSIRTVVDGAEDNLVATAGMDGIHVMDKRLHRLVDAADGAVHGVLQDTLLAFQTVQRAGEEVVHFLII